MIFTYGGGHVRERSGPFRSDLPAKAGQPIDLSSKSVDTSLQLACSRSVSRGRIYRVTGRSGHPKMSVELNAGQTRAARPRLP